MNPVSVNIIDMYMSVLASLSNDEKIDLIGRLLESMRNKKKITEPKPKKDIFECFTGDWSDFTPVRNFDRKVDIW